MVTCTFESGKVPVSFESGKVPVTFESGKVPGTFESGKVPGTFESGKVPGTFESGSPVALADLVDVFVADNRSLLFGETDRTNVKGKGAA